jgi:hypothetical protein
MLIIVALLLGCSRPETRTQVIERECREMAELRVKAQGREDSTYVKQQTEYLTETCVKARADKFIYGGGQ